MLEYVMLRMRLANGFSLSDFTSRFGVDFFFEFSGIEKFVQSGHVIKMGDRVAFSDKGFFVSSYILSEILDFS